MPDTRFHKSVADRCDLEFQQHKDPLHSRRRKAIWWCAGLSLIPLVYSFSTGDESIYWAHTVSTAHQIYQHDCHRCHGGRFEFVHVLSQGDEYVRQLENRTCRDCHSDRTSADHNSLVIDADVSTCFRCHQEHRRHDLLARIDDAHCTNCHTELKTKDGNHNFATSITSFRNHPEFAVRRTGPEHGPDPGSQHRVFELARQQDDGTWTDRVKFRFNHKAHLDPRGTLIPPTHPDYDPSQSTKENVVVMQCADCHQPDDAGRYMQPINYEKHCRQCHRLDFSKELCVIGPELGSTAPLEHEDPRTIRNSLRERLLAYAKRNAGTLFQTPDQPADPPRLPNKRAQPRAGSTAGSELAWVHERLDELEPVVFGDVKRKEESKFMQGCAQCHKIDKDDSGAADAAGRQLHWKIVPPDIPVRWMPHSRFNHDAHDMVSCHECHYKEPPSGPVEDPAEDAGSIYFSKSEDDVLMPSIQICHNCHARETNPLAQSEEARSDCVECHVYHSSNGSPHEQGLIGLFGTSLTKTSTS